MSTHTTSLAQASRGGTVADLLLTAIPHFTDLLPVRGADLAWRRPAGGGLRVQCKPGAAVQAEALTALVREAKGAVATPKRVEFLPALPLTALGKIDKKALRARHWPAGDRAVN